MRNLTTDEILVQLYYANKVCRVLRTDDRICNDGSNYNNINGRNTNITNSSPSHLLPPIDNVVFMGMGEPTDNLLSVVPAIHRMVSPTAGFGLSPHKITVSTVGPSPIVFSHLVDLPATLAWSVHAVRDDLRKELVPTTKWSMVELRTGLVEALRDNRRSSSSSKGGKKRRNVMLEVALMEGVNDGTREAEELADFSLRLVEEVEGGSDGVGMKLVVNLIPFNDIGHEKYRTPSTERVLAFQKVLVERGVRTYVRTTRGDDESAACGQLATQKIKDQR